MGYSITEIDPLEILDLARKAERGGKPVLDDPVIRERLVDFMIEAQAMRQNAGRAKLPPLNQDCPQALPLMSKLVMTEYMREINSKEQRAAIMLGSLMRWMMAIGTGAI